MKTRLRAYWGWLYGETKAKLLFDGPNGPDRRLLASILSEDAIDSLVARGYDLTTLRFRIDRPEAKR